MGREADTFPRCIVNLNINVMPCLLPKGSNTDTKSSCDLNHDTNLLLRHARGIRIISVLISMIDKILTIPFFLLQHGTLNLYLGKHREVLQREEKSMVFPTTQKRPMREEKLMMWPSWMSLV